MRRKSAINDTLFYCSLLIELVAAIATAAFFIIRSHMIIK